MGLKKKFKKAKKKATGTVRTVQKKTQKVANVPIVRTAVTAVATAYAGPAGAQAVNQGYEALNSDNPMDFVLGVKTSGYTKQFKGQSSQLSTVLPSSVNKTYKPLVNGYVKVSTPVRKKSFIDIIFEFFGF